MTPDKKRAILEAAARACGLPKHVDGMGFEQPYPYKWNPINNSLDTSALEAYVTKAGEVMREEAKEMILRELFHSTLRINLIDKVCALPAVTLEDLK